MGAWEPCVHGGSELRFDRDKTVVLRGAGTAPSWRQVGTRKVLRPVGTGTAPYHEQCLTGHPSAEKDIKGASKKEPAIATT